MPLFIIPGESQYEPDTVRGKVSACHGAPVRYHVYTEPAVNYREESLVCAECGAELTADELVDEEDEHGREQDRDSAPC